MPKFQLKGFSKKTNRINTREYLASDAVDAIRQASKEGLIVDVSTIQRVLVDHVQCTIAGVSHKNEDGSSRQKWIARCAPGDQLGLLAVPNKHSRHAVGVFTRARKQLGFIPDNVSARIKSELDSGAAVLCFVESIGRPSTGDEDDPPLGVSILLIIADRETDTRVLLDYVDAHVRDNGPGYEVIRRVLLAAR